MAKPGRRIRLRRRYRKTVIGLVILVIAACGDDSGDADETASPSPLTSTSLADAVLSGQELRRLIVTPPAPFVKVPDEELKSGLMEVGHPDSGVISLGYAQQEHFVSAGFQRGWESIFRIPDGQAVTISVLQFEASDGPLAMVDRFDGEIGANAERFAVASLPGVHAATEMSPEGNAAIAMVLARERFLVTIIGGGPPGARDYRQLVAELMSAQIDALP